MKKRNLKIALAFSGGLDTTYCAVYLQKVLGYEVHAILVNTGGFSETEIQKLEKHAFSIGVSSFLALDERHSFYEKVIKYLIFGNVLKNNTYPLSVSAERIVQAIAIAEHAKKIKADCIAHGSTGAGNDQVRFDMVFQILSPEMEIITPIRDLKLSREAEIAFLKEHRVEMNFEKAKYSINKGLWGTSVGGKETLTSHMALPEEAFPTQLQANESTEVVLHFNKGEMVAVNNQSFNNKADAINYLQNIAEKYAIGRDIHVGDTIIGIKGRVGFEAAAPLIIIKAHHLLEKHTLSKWQLFLKDQIAAYYGNWMHEGQYLEPAMRDIESFLESTQNRVTGKVFVKLLPYRFELIGVESAHDLMSEKFGSYGEMNNAWTGEDVKGFSKIFGNQIALYFNVNNLHHKNENS
jgi:argininosuccinate synthase